jgi:hypothetical protein
MKIIRAILIVNAVLAVVVLRGYGQAVSPVIVECGKHCNGEFTVSNPTISPVTVTVEAYSFALGADGKSILRPLDADADLQLDEMAARVGPQGAHTFGYKLRCTRTPCLVTVYVAMVVGHTNDGMAVRVLLPHVIYADAKQKGARARARAAAGLKE